MVAKVWSVLNEAIKILMILSVVFMACVLYFGWIIPHVPTLQTLNSLPKENLVGSLVFGGNNEVFIIQDRTPDGLRVLKITTSGGMLLPPNFRPTDVIYSSSPRADNYSWVVKETLLKETTTQSGR